MNKDFSKFLLSHDTKELQSDAMFRLDELPMSDKQKEILGAMSYGIALNLLQQYHEWLSSES